MGDSAQKKINSMLRMVFHDNVAALFNWKSQRGEKEKLCGRAINKMIGKKNFFTQITFYCM